MMQFSITDEELSGLARSIANRIWKVTPEIPKVSETRNWLQSQALDELNGLLKKKIEEEK
ncbi:hypothetical protein [Halanaerobium salsuginis]|uniref:Uncharacterized protein n=1 Tax=Halanaerobium salsuginis TaxID=29563 RepID=A0A1I4EVH2_9FIRM|nr:hypothetical protein [Halanaerobium salsuginis]SFL09745.1 hypothetical protein SAMN02983006_00173 [Halanaerobium salsuginis]